MTDKIYSRPYEKLSQKEWDRIFGIEGRCCECNRPCTDRDIVGNQVEFPMGYWCDRCITRHLEDDVRSKKHETTDPQRQATQDQHQEP